MAHRKDQLEYYFGCGRIYLPLLRQGIDGMYSPVWVSRHWAISASLGSVKLENSHIALIICCHMVLPCAAVVKGPIMRKTADQSVASVIVSVCERTTGKSARFQKDQLEYGFL
jgi:hypothetical protein